MALEKKDKINKSGVFQGEKEMWFKMISSYPATNCSSVNGVCSLKWEYGHKREIHGGKKRKENGSKQVHKFTKQEC